MLDNTLEIEYKDNKLHKFTPKPISNNQHNIAIVIHLFYSDIWHNEIKIFLSNIKIPFDTYITIPQEMEEDEIIEVCKTLPANTKVYLVENKGRDVLPFLKVLDIIGTDKYDYICKIHTKKSAGRDLGTVWRKLLYFELIGSNQIISNIVDMLDKDKNIGIITGKNTILDSEKYYLGNREKTNNLLKLLHLEDQEKYQFPGGTMFWIRTSILDSLLNLYRQNLLIFEDEQGQMDNTLAHAIERLFGILCAAYNKKIAGSPAYYCNLSEETLREMASLVLSQTYRGKDVFFEQNNLLAHKDLLLQNQNREIMNKDKQITLKDKQITFLKQLTLKKRLTQKIKKYIPSKFLKLFGFQPYHDLVWPEE
jgi:lipopolysaccharide biosynthesis protein